MIIGELSSSDFNFQGILEQRFFFFFFLRWIVSWIHLCVHFLSAVKETCNCRWLLQPGGLYEKEEGEVRESLSNE